MKSFLLALGILATLFSLTPSAAEARVPVCECREDGDKIKFFVAGKEIMDFGRWSTAPVECAKHMAAQSYCGSACHQPVCRCTQDGGKTKFFVAEKEIMDFGSWYTGAIECAKHLAAQSYCK